MESLFFHNAGLFILFNVVVLGMLALDLGVFNRKAHEVTLREALTWSGVWIFLSLCFAVIIYFTHGKNDAVMFLTGYIIEKSLSVDNIFVFIIIFHFFNVPARLQHKVLFWGILGALVMRATLIFVGIALIKEFEWLIYVLGAFLIFTGIKAARETDKIIDIGKNPVLRVMRRYLPVTDDYDGDKFISRAKGFAFTPLFVVLVLVETTDLIFALDSIPAILAVTLDPFIVYTSNVFAILGLRALYFVLADLIHIFRYLKLGVCVVLVFVGLKMIFHDVHKLPPSIALAVVSTILTVSVIASLVDLQRRRQSS